MKPILEIQNLSKRFKINHQAEPYLSFRDKLSHLFSNHKAVSEDFWALRKVNFSVAAGESVGIIGKNGAGKSTLLKILSKITPPTEGRIVSRGRMASLLEVGTGFHPELTGRENIFLNGSILGMKKAEIAARFDEIVDFAGTEKFLDTPLKHYSSGMQLRLAFAVAAFLEPEILVIDEVLAVGDAEFQKKCLGKMEDVSRSGRTLLFVSHNLMALENLCKRSIWLSQGELVAEGATADIVRSYISQTGTKSVDIKDLSHITRRQGTGKVVFTAVRIKGKDGAVNFGGEVEFEMTLENRQAAPGSALHLAVTLYNQHGVRLTTLDNLYSQQKVEVREGQFKVVCRLTRLMLLPAEYRVELWCADDFETFDLIEDVFSFRVEPTDYFGTGKLNNEAKHGNIVLDNEWSNAR